MHGLLGFCSTNGCASGTNNVLFMDNCMAHLWSINRGISGWDSYLLI